MDRESNNVFNEGLVSDLNPLTTPNNVLVDCLNGTFLTFDGNELVLQNDAGNTIISEKAKLKDHYYPLGIKEYGGVLYIVSARTIVHNLQEFKSGNLYKEDDIVASNISGEWCIYRCIKNTETTTLLDNENYWENLGDLENAKKKYERIEIGSYPSINIPNEENKFSGTANININKINKKTTIGSADFKSGEYITFSSLLKTGDSGDIRNNFYEIQKASFDSEGNLTLDLNKLYRIEVSMLLKTGVVDLTDSIWDQYQIWVRENCENAYDEHTHWALENNEEFKYYCPYNYKGKLLVSLVVDIPQLIPVTLPYLDVSEKKIKYQYTKNDSSTALKISGYTVYVDDDNKKFYNFITDSNSGVIHTDDDEYTDIGELSDEQIFNILICPNYKYEVDSEEVYDILYDIEDKKYKTWHYGTVIISPEILNETIQVEQITYSKATSRYRLESVEERCDGNLSTIISLKVVDEWTPGDGGLNLNGGESYVGFVLSKDNSRADAPPEMLVIGTFEIGNNYKISKIVLDANYETEYSYLVPVIDSYIEKFIVQYSSTKCNETETTMQLSLPLIITDDFSQVSGAIISIFQDTSRIPYTTNDGKNYKFNVDPSKNVNISITFTNTSFVSISHIINNVQSIKTKVNFGLVLSFYNVIYQGSSDYELHTLVYKSWRISKTYLSILNKFNEQITVSAKAGQTFAFSVSDCHVDWDSVYCWIEIELTSSSPFSVKSGINGYMPTQAYYVNFENKAIVTEVPTLDNIASEDYCYVTNQIDNGKIFGDFICIGKQQTFYLKNPDYVPTIDLYGTINTNTQIHTPQTYIQL